MTTNILSHPTAETIQRPRDVERLIAGQPTSDGAGVKLTRVLTQPLQRRLDPFLMLDAFGTDNPQDYIGGFPDHPHRGFETITYMIAGRMRHRDSAGHEGLLQNGSVQWMTAGRGVIHSELPEQENGRMEGFQLWLNLPAKDKMRAPWYADIPAGAIPSFDVGGATVKLISGEWDGHKGPGPERVTAPFLADVTVPANGVVDVPLPDGHAGFIYAFEGELRLGSETIAKGNIGVLTSDGSLQPSAGANGARFLVVAGKPLREPIAKYGPFVMNTADEIRAAISDYQNGRF